MAKAKASAITKSVKHKVGDYVCAPDRVFIRIVAVIDSGLGPMYGCVTPTHSDHIHWKSQYELDSESLVRGTPNFEGCNQLVAGDILRVGQNEKSSVYVTILARVGEAILLSSAPDKRLAERLLQLDKVMKDVTEDTGLDITDFFDDEDMRNFKRIGSQLHASKIAGNWMPIETLALMNWDIIKE